MESTIIVMMMTTTTMMMMMMTMFMGLSSRQSYYQSSPGSFYDPQTRPYDLGREFACRPLSSTPTITIRY